MAYLKHWLSILFVVFSFAVGAHAVEPADVINHYADIAEATYQDSLDAADTLHSAIAKFLQQPDVHTHQAAKQAWLAARVPYQQSEVFRFGNAIVDAWEGRVNAWPLDEGLIDYVDLAYGVESDENALYTANVIANSAVTIDGRRVEAAVLSPAFIAETLHEAGGIEANVASGYHAIEFLLWGQDLNGTSAGAGARPATDYDLANCTNGNCDRRRTYLTAVSQLLVSDLGEMVSNWAKDGDARLAIQADEKAGLSAVITGMGSLSYGELAGERMKLGLLLGDPEEEHDCFSDNTHNSHYYDALGVQNIYLGRYTRLDGTIMSGPSLADLIGAAAPQLDQEIQQKLATTMAAMTALVNRAEAVEAYDQMIAIGNVEGRAILQTAIDGLIDQTQSFERAIVLLDLAGVDLEGSDSLDNPSAVFQ